MNMFELFKYGQMVIVKLTKYGLQVIFKLTKLRSALIEHFSIHKNPKLNWDRRDSRAGQNWDNCKIFNRLPDWFQSPVTKCINV